MYHHFAWRYLLFPPVFIEDCIAVRLVLFHVNIASLPLVG